MRFVINVRVTRLEYWSQRSRRIQQEDRPRVPHKSPAQKSRSMTQIKNTFTSRQDEDPPRPPPAPQPTSWPLPPVGKLIGDQRDVGADSSTPSYPPHLCPPSQFASQNPLPVPSFNAIVPGSRLDIVCCHKYCQCPKGIFYLSPGTSIMQCNACSHNANLHTDFQGQGKWSWYSVSYSIY